MNECELFRQKMEPLYSSFQAAKADAEGLAIALYSRSIVGKGVRDEVCDSAVTPSKAASKLLSAVETRIESYPRDINTFIDLLETFPPLKEHADDMRRKLNEMESRIMLPQPVSESSLQSQTNQPVNIRLIISGGSSVLANGNQPEERDTFELRSAPVHRKRPESSHNEPTASKSFTQPSSPLVNSSLDLSERHSSSSSLSMIPEEATCPNIVPGRLDSQTSSLTSQLSTSSSIEEEIVSVRGSLDGIIQKYRSLQRQLRHKDKKVKSLEEELTVKQKMYEGGMDSANQENKQLQDQMRSLRLENKQLKEEVDDARASVVTSNFLKQQLLDQLQGYFTEVKKYREHCEKLELQVKEASEGIDFYSEYQKAEAKVKEQEEKIESYKRIIKEHEEKIALLETEIEILVSAESSSYTSTAGITSVSDQDDSNSM